MKFNLNKPTVKTGSLADEENPCNGLSPASPSGKPVYVAWDAAKSGADTTIHCNAEEIEGAFSIKLGKEIINPESNPNRATLIDKLTHETKEIRLPTQEEQPNMRALKKPICNTDTSSFPVLQKPLSEQSNKELLQTLGIPCSGKAVAKSQATCTAPPQKDLQSSTKAKPPSRLSLGNTKEKENDTLVHNTSNSITLGMGNELIKPKCKPKPFKLSGNQARSTKASTPPKRDLLHGTGLTKAMLQSTEKRHNKAAQKVESSKLDTGGVAAIAESEIAIGELPDSLLDTGIALDKYQQAAVAGLQNQKYGVLIGAAGTGKTTALKFLLAAIENQVQLVSTHDLPTRHKDDKSEAKMLPAFAFCSFTGKAVQQMKRALPEIYHPLANTIHATLGYAPVMEEYFDEEEQEHKEHKVFRPSYDTHNKLPYKIIIVDETGTLSLHLWHELLAACTADCRIFFIGDLNQLPPVSGHSILGFAMLNWPTFALEELHRQAEGDPIAENAHRILRGAKPLTDKETMRFIVRNIKDGSKGARKELLQVVQHLHKQGQFDPIQDALIVPQNIGPIGQIEFNNVLVHYFNPVKIDEDGNQVNPRTIITAGYAHLTFAVGDKVMLLANDTQKRLTNGMVGIVTKIALNGTYKGEAVASQIDIDMGEIDLSDMANELEDDDGTDDKLQESERASSHIMTVKFQNVDDEINFNTAGAYKKVALAYAMTCHKAQGSEYRNVIVLAHAANLKMLCREWLYTAITRAKERVFLLTNHRGLTHAVRNQRIKGDSIADKAEKFLKLQGKEVGESPAKLPDAVEIKQIKPLEIV